MKPKRGRPFGSLSNIDHAKSIRPEGGSRYESVAPTFLDRYRNALPFYKDRENCVIVRVPATPRTPTIVYRQRMDFNYFSASDLGCSYGILSMRWIMFIKEASLSNRKVMVSDVRSEMVALESSKDAPRTVISVLHKNGSTINVWMPNELKTAFEDFCKVVAAEQIQAELMMRVV